MSSAKIPPDLGKYLDALLVIETIDDAKELIANPEVIEDLEFHEAETTEVDEEKK
jgi:hypothetical protein